jgi:hypothetical protein
MAPLLEPAEPSDGAEVRQRFELEPFPGGCAVVLLGPEYGRLTLHSLHDRAETARRIRAALYDLVVTDPACDCSECAARLGARRRL